MKKQSQSTNLLLQPLSNLKAFIVNNKLEMFILLVLILATAFVRLYQIDKYMTFLGDEGRDVLVVKRILVDHDFPLLGPPTSVGNMYDGPLYYYMMAAAMAISWLNPVAAAVMVALIGTASVILIYFLTRGWFDKLAAIIAAALYSFSPVNIIYSHSSWNPNPAPFFSLLIVSGLYKLHLSKNFLWLILVGASFAFVIQMHLLSLIMLPIILIMIAIEFKKKIVNKAAYKNIRSGIAGGILAFSFLMSPMVIFDLKYNFENFNAFKAFFFGDRSTTVNLNIFNAIGRIWPIYNLNLIQRYISGTDPVFSVLVSLLVLLPIIYLIWLVMNKRFSWPLGMVSIWLIVGIVGLSLYKQSIFDHYLTFMNPAPFILLGSLAYLLDKFKMQKLLLGIFYTLILGLAIYLLYINIQRSPLQQKPNNQLERTQQIAQFVIKQSNDKPFNFALLSAHNYDAAYQYYLDLDGHKPLVVPDHITDQLFVVCEDPVCQPINNPKYEIAAFGWSKIINQTQFDGVQVFKLEHNYPASTQKMTK